MISEWLETFTYPRLVAKKASQRWICGYICVYKILTYTHMSKHISTNTYNVCIYCFISILHLYLFMIYTKREKGEERRERERSRFKRVKDSGSEFIHQEFSLTLVLRDLQSKIFLIILTVRSATWYLSTYIFMNPFLPLLDNF